MFFLIDKPLGMTSFDVIRKLRKALQIKKMWHTGTLDPLASGLLLVATGNSTKLIPLLESARKEYITTIHLDGKSDSYDMGTPIMPISGKKKEKTATEIEDFLLALTSQTPPKYSALHIDGQRAYDLARKWEDFHIKPRAITIYAAKVLSQSEMSVELQLTVSSGCYIRSLAPVLGGFCDVEWWYLSALRRTKIETEYGALDLSMMSDIENPVEIPYSKLFHTFPTIEINDSIYKDLLEWREIPLDNLPSAHLHEWEKLFLSYEEMGFLSLWEIQNGKYRITRNNV